MTEQSLSVFRSDAGAADYRAAYEKTLALWPAGVQPLELQTRFGATRINALGNPTSPPLLLIHGYCASSTQWYPNAGALAEHFRVFAPDVPDQPGLSSLDNPIQTRENYALWLADLLDGLDCQRAFFVGHSYGGWLSTNFAITSPERVRKLVLISPAATVVSLTPEFMLRGFAMGFAGALNIDRPIYGMMKWMATTRPVVGLELVEQFKTGIKNMAPTPAGFPDVFDAQEFARLTMPVLLLIGEHEVIYKWKAQRVIEEAQRLVPGIQTGLVPGGGHMVTLDQAEATNHALLEFLLSEIR
jgi:pimeloyl-ACP methyl ester carboxylesterase